MTLLNATPSESPRLCLCGCGNAIKAGNTHYRNHVGLALSVRLAEKITITEGDGCYPCKGSTKNGYGRISHHGVSLYAHRVAWELAKGPIPEGLFVCHHCDNPLCCRVSHMFLGPPEANTHDMWSKGRGKLVHHRGEKHPLKVLTDDKVLEIRAKAGTMSQMALAKEYGTCQSNIGFIVNRITWTHI